jgi:hypothetical protein
MLTGLSGTCGKYFVAFARWISLSPYRNSHTSDNFLNLEVICTQQEGVQVNFDITYGLLTKRLCDFLQLDQI